MNKSAIFQVMSPDVSGLALQQPRYKRFKRFRTNKILLYQFIQACLSPATLHGVKFNRQLSKKENFAVNRIKKTLKIVLFKYHDFTCSFRIFESQTIVSVLPNIVT